MLIKLLAKQKGDYAVLEMLVPQEKLSSFQKEYEVVKVIKKFDEKEVIQTQKEIDLLLK